MSHSGSPPPKATPLTPDTLQYSAPPSEAHRSTPQPDICIWTGSGPGRICTRLSETPQNRETRPRPLSWHGRSGQDSMTAQLSDRHLSAKPSHGPDSDSRLSQVAWFHHPPPSHLVSRGIPMGFATTKKVQSQGPKVASRCTWPEPRSLPHSLAASSPVSSAGDTGTPARQSSR